MIAPTPYPRRRFHFGIVGVGFGDMGVNKRHCTNGFLMEVGEVAENREPKFQDRRERSRML